MQGLFEEFIAELKTKDAAQIKQELKEMEAEDKAAKKAMKKAKRAGGGSEADGDGSVDSALLEDEKIFDYVISNPPYQTENRKTQNGVGGVSNIFQKFQICAQDYARASIMIYPGGRWIRQSGRGLKKFGKELINDTHLRSVDYVPGENAASIFPSVNIGDGLSIVCWDQEFNEYFFYLNDNKTPSPGDKKIPLADSVITSLISRLMDKFDSVSDRGDTYRRIVFYAQPASEQVSFKVKEYPEPPQELQNPMRALLNDVRGKKGRVHEFWVENTITENADVLDKYKVCMNSNIQGNELPSKFRFHVIDAGVAPNWSRITLGVFDTEQEAVNFYHYIDSHIARVLMKAGSGARDRIGHTIASFVPDLGDYTSNNPDIDWDEPLDPQLYKLFRLTEEEIAAVEG